MTTAWSLWPIGCSDAPPLLEPQLGTTGALSISTVTAGGEFDLDGYVVLLDGASSGRIDLSASLMLPGLEPSDRSVELADLAPKLFGDGKQSPERPRGRRQDHERRFRAHLHGVARARARSHRIHE